ELVIGTSGSFTVRKNGNNTNDFGPVTVNTRPGTNNYANKIQLGAASGAAQPTIDDFLWRSDASSVSWVGDVRCYVRHPTSDVSVQLSRTSTAINTQMVNLGVPSPQNWGTYANYVQFVAPSSGLLSGVSFPNSAGGTGHAKAALFSSVNNLPAAVL